MELIDFRHLPCLWLEAQGLHGGRKSPMKVIMRGHRYRLSGKEISQYGGEKQGISFEKLRAVTAAERLARKCIEGVETGKDA